MCYNSRRLSDEMPAAEQYTLLFYLIQSCECDSDFKNVRQWMNEAEESYSIEQWTWYAARLEDLFAARQQLVAFKVVNPAMARQICYN